jgi:hypothetical protein
MWVKLEKSAAEGMVCAAMEGGVEAQRRRRRAPAEEGGV